MNGLYFKNICLIFSIGPSSKGHHYNFKILRARPKEYRAATTL